MSDTETRNPFFSVHIPITLIAIALSLFFAMQNKSISQNDDRMKWQHANADKAIKSYQEAKATLEKNVEERKALVAQSEQTQKQFTDMMKELNDLARGGDKDAEKVITGYGIKINDPVTEKKADDKK